MSWDRSIKFWKASDCSIKFWKTKVFYLSVAIALFGIGAFLCPYVGLTRLGQILGALVVVSSLAQVLIQGLAEKWASAPRILDATNAASLSQAVGSFAGLRVVLGAVPASEANTNLAEQILGALTAAKVDTFINYRGVAAEVDPAQNSWLRAAQGVPTGVVAFFMSGNSRAEAFSNAFTNALNQVGITAVAKGGYREDWVKSLLSRQPEIDRNNENFEPVTVVVGDRP